MKAMLRLTATIWMAITLISAPSHAATTTHLQASDFRFCNASDLACSAADSPHSTTVVVGDAVDWVYNDYACDALMSCRHNITILLDPATNPPTETGGDTINRGGIKPMVTPQMFSWTFTKAGTYQYWCTAHKGFGMIGTVVVQ